MDSQTFNFVVRRLQQAADPARSTADSELLSEFVQRRDAQAFSEIIRRHGPMVLGVCRRVLQNTVDADDAFQATFLVLIRRAASLRSPDRLAGWLHQVASRTARKLRAMRMARQRREGKLLDVAVGAAPAEIVWRELRPIFDEELGLMPDKLRLPAVLCFLEGLSKSEAARVLGWPEGTVSGRLQRARERLRLRFLARGLTLSSGALALAFFEGAGVAAIPESLFAATRQLIASVPTASTVQSLSNGVIHAMFMTKAKAIAVAVLAIGAIGTGTGVALVPGSGPGEIVAGETPAKQPATPAAKGKAKQIAAHEITQRERDLALLKERLEWEERMVAKGYMNHTMTLKTKQEIAHAESVLEKGESPKTPDARLQAMEEVIRKLELIVEKTAEGVRRGIVPEQELLNAKLNVLKYKFRLLEASDAPDQKKKEKEEIIEKMEALVEKTADGVRKAIVPQQELFNAQQCVLEHKFRLLENGDRHMTDPQSSRQRQALEAVIPRLERIVQKTEDGVKKGIVPEMDLLNAQATLLRYKLELARVSDRPQGEDAIKNRQALIDLKQRDLVLAEALLEKKAISTEQVRRLRIDLHRLRAEAAEADGDYSEALKQREAVKGELQTLLDQRKALVDQKVISLSQLQAARVELANAKVEALQDAVRQQLAEIVAIREQELRALKALFAEKSVSAEALHKSEQALAEANLRLAEGK